MATWRVFWSIPFLLGPVHKVGKEFRALRNESNALYEKWIEGAGKMKGRAILVEKNHSIAAKATQCLVNAWLRFMGYAGTV
jgi:hypothetical protein